MYIFLLLGGVILGFAVSLNIPLLGIFGIFPFFKKVFSGGFLFGGNSFWMEVWRSRVVFIENYTVQMH